MTDAGLMRWLSKSRESKYTCILAQDLKKQGLMIRFPQDNLTLNILGSAVSNVIGISVGCISIEGRSGGSHDVTPAPCLLDGDGGHDAAVTDSDEVAHGAT